MLKRLVSLYDKLLGKEKPKEKKPGTVFTGRGEGHPKRSGGNFSKQFYQSGMSQPPEIPEFLRRGK